MTELMRSDIWQFPKVDLHQHLDGAVRPETVMRLARKFGVKLPTDNLEEFKRLYRIGKEMSVDELFKRFAWAIAVMRTPEGLETVAYEAVLDLAQENIGYAELRFAPGYHSLYPAPFYTPEVYEAEPFRIMTLQETVEAVLRGLKRGSRETGVIVNLTLCIPRECLEQYGPQSAFDIATLAIQYQHQGVVSLDLACYETARNTLPYAFAFGTTLNTKIRRNPHAGEMGSREQQITNIIQAIYHLRANGLGHAYALHHSNVLMDAVLLNNIRIERHPLGAFAPPLAESGLDALVDAGIKVSIISDDPALYGQTLTENLEAALSTYGWGERELARLIANGLNSAFFASPEQAREVKARFIARGINHKLLT